MVLNPDNKGEPRVISDTEDEEITPDNPEIVKQFPVDTKDPKAVEEVEGTKEQGSEVQRYFLANVGSIPTVC